MIAIHTLTPADFDDWEPLWQGYLSFYQAELSDNLTRLAFERLTNPTEAMYGFLARDDEGRAVGMVNWLTHRATWARNNYCYLEDLFVIPEARGTSAGRALIEAVYPAAGELGCPNVYWLTHEANAEARKLYDRIAERSGFIHYRHKL
jgi:GNAT superfamily N-acetyltransferase